MPLRKLDWHREEYGQGVGECTSVVALSGTTSTKERAASTDSERRPSGLAHTQSLGVEMVLQIDNVLSLNLDARPSPNRGEFAIDPEEASSSEDGTLVCTRVSRGRFVAIGRIRSTSRDRPPLCDGYCSARRIG